MQSITYLRFLILLFAIVCCFEAIAQSKEKTIVEILKSASPSVHDSLYYELFRNELYGAGNLQRAKGFAFKAYQESKRMNHTLLFAKACRALGMLNRRLELLDSSKYFYLQGINAAKSHGHLELLVYATNELGNYYQNQDVYDSALKYFQISLEHATKLKMSEDMAFTLNNIGLVFYYLNNYSEALENLKASLEIKRENDLGTIGISLKNIALVYNDQERYEKAIELLQEVESKYLDEFDAYNLADLYDDLAYAHFHTENFEESLIYYRRAFEKGKETGNRRVMANALHHLGEFSLKRGGFTESRDYFIQALTIANELKLRRLKRDIYLSLQNLYRAQGNLEKIIEYQGKYMAIKDSIFNEQMANNLKEIQLNAQKKQSEAIIQQKDSEIERVRLITALVGVIALLLVVLSVMIYRNYRTSHRLKMSLEREVKKRTSDLVKSNENLTQMTQEYDQLVYRASHDIRGPLATLMGLTNIAKQDYEEPLRVKDYLDKIGSTAMGLNQTLSQLMETNRIRNHPIVVEDIDLGGLVDEVYGSFKSLNHFPLISFRIEKGEWSQPLLTDRNLVGFILTKLLDNAFRYFSSYKDEKYIKISWSQSDDKTVIAVEDNGSGIDAKAKEKIFQLFYVASDHHGSGLGLFLAQMAANRLGGRVILARSSSPTIFKLVISSNLSKAQVEDKPFMTVAS